MQQIQVTIKGISPMLMNPMTDETLDELFAGAGARKARKTDRTKDDVAAAKVIRDSETGLIGVPVEYLMAALVYAGKFVKFDARKNLSSGTSSLVTGLIAIDEMFLPFKNQEPPAGQSTLWEVDTRRGRLASTGVAVAVVRPKFKNWEFDVTISYDPDEISESKVRDLIEKAGQFAGLADFRPSCKGPFGRFTVSKWEALERQLSEAA